MRVYALRRGACVAICEDASHGCHLGIVRAYVEVGVLCATCVLWASIGRRAWCREGRANDVDGRAGPLSCRDRGRYDLLVNRRD